MLQNWNIEVGVSWENFFLFLQISNLLVLTLFSFLGIDTKKNPFVIFSGKSLLRLLFENNRNVILLQ
jgi:hypothetical protein